MLGSVAERGKEIFIFSSLGLAPIHWCPVPRRLDLCHPWWSGRIHFSAVPGGRPRLSRRDYIGVQPDLNYSSLTAVVTILMVMSTAFYRPRIQLGWHRIQPNQVKTMTSLSP